MAPALELARLYATSKVAGDAKAKGNLAGNWVEQTAIAEVAGGSTGASGDGDLVDNEVNDIASGSGSYGDSLTASTIEQLSDILNDGDATSESGNATADGNVAENIVTTDIDTEGIGGSSTAAPSLSSSADPETTSLVNVAVSNEGSAVAVSGDAFAIGVVAECLVEL